jgi:hypothetical protein
MERINGQPRSAVLGKTVFAEFCKSGCDGLPISRMYSG